EEVYAIYRTFKAYLPGSLISSFSAMMDSLGSMITTYPLQSLLSEAELHMGQTCPSTILRHSLHACSVILPLPGRSHSPSLSRLQHQAIPASPGPSASWSVRSCSLWAPSHSG